MNAEIEIEIEIESESLEKGVAASASTATAKKASRGFGEYSGSRIQSSCALLCALALAITSHVAVHAQPKALATASSPAPASPAPAPASSTSLSPQDAALVRTVVQSQLAAFAADDAVKAFSYAAPNIRKTFGTASVFLDMVRRGYPVVYRPASSAFLTVEGAGSQAVQRVRLQDAAGDSYVAVYTLERQKNKIWLITGCQVVASKGQTA